MAIPCTYTLILSLSYTFFIITISSPSYSEKDILLTFKASLEDTKNSLSSWSNTSTTHYCNWTGVSCTNTLSVSSLNLQNLNLSGEISSAICELTHLSHLNLADNSFNQPIPLHLSECTSLETLNLSNNLIWSTIPDQISQFSSLKVLDVSRNHVEGKIPEGLGFLKSLQVLNLGSNLLSGNVPPLFENLTELSVIDLSENLYLVSEIPTGIGKLKKLEQLLLHNSGFHGQIPDSLVGLLSLKMLDFSENNLTGRIPQALGSSLKNLVSFDVSENKLVGSFPSGICTRKNLINLSLHTNFFNGSIPDSFDDCTNLEKFQVQNNGFYGDFPAGLWSLPKIKLIRAENNRFSGVLPDSIAMATQLEQVQIDNNGFGGKIPRGLGSVKSLYRFSASLNGFNGELPPTFCDSPVMSIMNFSHNRLAGRIPELKKCKKLVSLSLADNSLVGEIPPSLAALPVLTYLDLSQNNLTGSIPPGLQNLKLALFNVSFNNLAGEVPSLLVTGLPASFLQGNPDLCGPGLSNPCSQENPRRQNFGLTTVTCALISLAFGIGTLILAAVFFMYHKSFKRNSQADTWHSVFFYPLRVSEHDLIMGMNEKDVASSPRGFGRVYSVSLPSGELVAVKKLVNIGSQSSKALRAEVKTLAKIRYKSIIKILGFFHSDDAIFLIYEHLPRGSLGDLVSMSDFQMPWSIRLKIAVGVARGLEYLHKDYAPHLLHRNIKANNILLDEDFEPKITDFALDRIVGESSFQSTVASEFASSCYNAPECGYSKKPSEQMDVYSFGVVLLELVSGRPADQTNQQTDSLDIVKWVRRKINITNGALQVLDPKISSFSQQEMLGALDIALQCTSVMPEKRPSMSEVVRGLQCLNSKSCLSNVEFFASDLGSSPV